MPDGIPFSLGSETSSATLTMSGNLYFSILAYLFLTPTPIRACINIALAANVPSSSLYTSSIDSYVFGVYLPFSSTANTRSGAFVFLSISFPVFGSSFIFGERSFLDTNDSDMYLFTFSNCPSAVICPLFTIHFISASNILENVKLDTCAYSDINTGNPMPVFEFTILFKNVLITEPPSTAHPAFLYSFFSIG